MSNITLYPGIDCDIHNIYDYQMPIESIAHALSLQCRYNGHCHYFFSVAEHSLLVVDIMKRFLGITDKKLLLAGLLHDASEYFLGDIVRPLKQDETMSAYRELEESVHYRILQHFQIPQIGTKNELIRSADEIALVTEACKLVPGSERWKFKSDPCNIHMNFFRPPEAKQAFITRFNELTTYTHNTTDMDSMLRALKSAISYMHRTTIIKNNTTEYTIYRFKQTCYDAIGYEEQRSKWQKHVVGMYSRVKNCNPELFKA